MTQQDKVKQTNYTLMKRVLAFSLPYKKVLLLSLLFCVLLSFLGPLRPLMINYAVDHYIVGIDNISNKECFRHDVCQPDLYGLKVICIVLIGLLILESVSQFFYIYLATWLGQHVIQDMRVKVYKHILSLRMSFFDKTPIGSLVSRTVSDIETISEIFSQGLFVIIGEILKLVVIICFMLYTDWRLTLLSMVSIPLLLIATAWFKKNIKATFQQVRKEVSNINTFVQEHITGMNIVQIFGREEAEYKQFIDINKDHLNANLRSVFYYSVFFPVVEILSAISIAMIIWYGGESIISGNNVTQGELFAFILYIYMMFRPIRQLADRFNILQMGIVGAERVFKILDTQEIINDQGDVSHHNFIGNIRYKNVSFAYKKNDLVLKNISFDIDSGMTLALVGSTGSGKTSIINLLNRSYEFQSGSIEIDEISLIDYKIDLLRKNISVVHQDVHLFTSSILDNIILYDTSISKEDVIKASKEIGSHDFIMTLPGGYEYVVGERGVTISTGQRQLIAFLRVYVRNHKILILDESTSSIDSETEHLLQNALEKVSKGRTTIIIAHRLSTIVNADKIILLDSGEIIESGDHASLMKLNGRYKMMYENQISVL